MERVFFFFRRSFTCYAKGSTSRSDSTRISLTSTSDCERALFRFFLCVCTSHLAHTHRGSRNESFIPSTCSCSCERFSSPCSPLLLHALLAALLPLLPALEVRRQPAHSAQREWTCLTSSSSPQVMSPTPTTSRRLLSSTTQSSPPFFSDKGFPEDAEYDDAALEGMLREAHRVHSHHSLREDLSVSLSSSSVSDRMERPVGDRAGRRAEQNSQDAQIRILLEKQKEQILAECQAEINRHELQAAYDRRGLRKLGEIVKSQQEELHCARAEEVQRRDQHLLQGQLLQQNLELREAHQKSLSEMEELKKFQSSAFDTIARRRLVEEQDTILELSGRIQELQNEINCMSDSKDFQDAESVRSGNSHVTSRPVSFPLHPVPEGMLSRSCRVPRRREGPPSIWDTHGISGNVFADPVASSTAPYPQELNPWNSSIEEPLHSRTKSRSEMPVWTASQRFSHPQWWRLFKELWGRPTTTADFGSSF